MYAVIETGGKQYRVEVGTELEVELLDVEPGQIDHARSRPPRRRRRRGRRSASPLVDGAAVERRGRRARTRGDKVIVFKYRPKARTPRQEGSSPGADRPPHRRHRASAARAPPRPQPRPRTDAKTERQRLEEAAAAPGRQGRRARREARPLAAKAAPRSRRREAAAAKPSTAEGQPTTREGQPSRQGRREAGDQGQRRAGRRSRRRGRRRRRPPEAAPRRSGHRAHARRTSNRWPTRRQAAASRTAATASASGSASRPATASSCRAGSIIVRQRGMTFLSGPGHRARQGLHRLRDGRRAGCSSSTRPKTKKRIRVEAVETVAGDGLRPDRTGHSRRPPARQWPARTASEETPVKPDIHPKYYQAKVHCGSCGTEFDRRFHAPGAARRRLLQLPPVLHGQADHHRHRRPGRALPEAPRAPARG